MEEKYIFYIYHHSGLLCEQTRTFHPLYLGYKKTEYSTDEQARKHCDELIKEGYRQVAGDYNKVFSPSDIQRIEYCKV